MGGQFEIAYQSFTVHGSGKVKHRGGLLYNTLKRKDIFLSKRIQPSCSWTGKGTSYVMSGDDLKVVKWWKDYSNSLDSIEMNDQKRPKAYFSTNFKPWRDTIYFLVYESDALFNDAYNTETEVFYRAGKSAILRQYARKHEGAFGDKNKSSKIKTWGASYGFRNMSVVRITPDMWPNTPSPSRVSDVLILTGNGSNSGANGDEWSLNLKIKYGF